MEIQAGPSGRRRWPDELKARIVVESYAPGVRVADVARLHGATRGQLYDWRCLARKGQLALPEPIAATPAFAAVVVEEAPRSGKCSAPSAAPLVEIVVGGVVIRALEGVGAEHLATAIRAVRLAAP